MGSENATSNSSESRIHKNKKYFDSGKIYNFNSSLPYLNNDFSSYHGLLIDEKINLKSKKQQTDSDEEINENADTASTLATKIPIKFEYKEGGNEVLIAGSFTNWKEKKKMTKNNNGIFEIELFLPKGKYQFKFVVDGIWKCSNNILQEKDARGIKNNVIEVVENNNINNNEKIKKYKHKNSVCQSRGKLILDDDKKKISLEEMEKKYGCYFPEKYQFNDYAPKLPENYNVLVNINDNSNQKYFGRKKFLNIQRISFNNSFKNIMQPYHIYLDHLLTKSNNCEIKILRKNNNLKNKKNNISKKVIANENINSSMSINETIKTRKKFTSIVYYYPLSQ